jgi:hypothetical protein
MHYIIDTTKDFYFLLFYFILFFFQELGKSTVKKVWNNLEIQQEFKWKKKPSNLFQILTDDDDNKSQGKTGIEKKKERCPEGKVVLQQNQK